MFILLAIIVVSASNAQITPLPRDDITPVPKADRHEKEFLAMDADSDGNVTFTEFLLSDRPFIEHMSQKFHRFDEDGDATVTREEFDAFYVKVDKERQQREKEQQNFFKNMGGQAFASPFFNDFFLRKQDNPPPTPVNETMPSPLEFSSFLFI